MADTLYLGYVLPAVQRVASNCADLQLATLPNHTVKNFYDQLNEQGVLVDAAVVVRQPILVTTLPALLNCARSASGVRPPPGGLR